jgi:hypothetical protein
MAARHFLKIDSKDLRRLAEHLRVYSLKCDEAAKKLDESPVTFVVTDGYSSTVDGLVRLRKFVREFVGELGLPPDDLAEDRDKKIASVSNAKVAEETATFKTKLKNSRKPKKP